MAATQLFGDLPSGFTGIAGAVSPNIQADITQKSEEDDASTLAGYKKRLELQSGAEESAYQNKLAYQRQLQLQWEQEDLKRQADEMRKLDASRREAFNVIYEPQAKSSLEMMNQSAAAAAAASNQQAANSQLHRPQNYQASPGQVQQALNTMYGRQATIQQGANTNPYYSNPYAGTISARSSGGPIGIRDPVTGIYG